MARRERRTYPRPMTSAIRKPPDLTGIEVRHARPCPTAVGRQCTCSPSYRAVVWSGQDQRKVAKTLATLRAAQIWRQDARTDLRRGVLRAPKPVTLRQVGEKWLEDAQAGVVRNRSGDAYKPS